tara:strand:+ start:210 stop:455 length:246 start_codon:yes stop_codon:yes gene_type:complete
MPRKHGYSKKGTPCPGTQDWQAKGQANAMGALMGMTFSTVALFDGDLNWDVFLCLADPGSVTQNSSGNGDYDGKCQLSQTS